VTPPVRVLWLVKGLGPGGAEQLLVHQARAYARAAGSGGSDPEGLSFEAAYLVPWKDHHVAALVDAGVPTTCLDGARAWDLRWTWRLRRRLARDPVDVVHVHSPLVAAFTRLVVRTLPRHTRPALVYTEHNRWPRHQPATRLLNRLTIGLDDADLAVSDDVRASMAPRVRPRVEVLVHGVDLESVRARAAERDDVRAELGVGADEVVVGIVANFRREKAYDVFLAAAALAIAEEPSLRFVSVGQGPLEDEMRSRLAGLGAGDRVRLLGYRDDAVRVMSGFDVFTLTSTHEGLPVSLMDALALGLPVVATAVGGVPQAVTDGVEAVLVPPGRPDLLAGAYVALARDPDRRGAMAEAARARSAGFDVTVAAARQADLYRALAASRSA
jgi:L-malate glycosyltransferase